VRAAIRRAGKDQDYIRLKTNRGLVVITTACVPDARNCDAEEALTVTEKALKATPAAAKRVVSTSRRGEQTQPKNKGERDRVANAGKRLVQEIRDILAEELFELKDGVLRGLKVVESVGWLYPSGWSPARVSNHIAWLLIGRHTPEWESRECGRLLG